MIEKLKHIFMHDTRKWRESMKLQGGLMFYEEIHKDRFRSLGDDHGNEKPNMYIKISITQAYPYGQYRAILTDSNEPILCRSKLDYMRTTPEEALKALLVGMTALPVSKRERKVIYVSIELKYSFQDLLYHKNSASQYPYDFVLDKVHDILRLEDVEGELHMDYEHNLRPENMLSSIALLISQRIRKDERNMLRNDPSCREIFDLSFEENKRHDDYPNQTVKSVPSEEEFIKVVPAVPFDHPSLEDKEEEKSLSDAFEEAKVNLGVNAEPVDTQEYVPEEKNPIQEIWELAQIINKKLADKNKKEEASISLKDIKKAARQTNSQGLFEYLQRELHSEKK